jgi:hypothetical protein
VEFRRVELATRSEGNLDFTYLWKGPRIAVIAVNGRPTRADEYLGIRGLRPKSF